VASLKVQITRTVIVRFKVLMRVTMTVTSSVVW